MKRMLCGAILWLAAVSQTRAEDPTAIDWSVDFPQLRKLFNKSSILPVRYEGEPEGEGNGNGKNGKNGNGEAPEHTRDNAMFVEEAVNQEAGVVQHIFNWVPLWDRANGISSRNFAFLYTMELPLGSQKHQFSFTTTYLTAFEKPEGGQATQRGDVGDTFLNYRYQLLADDDFLWCAPRVGIILPTGDERFGLGTGQVGYQLGLPISRYTDLFDYHFNAGVTYIPGVSQPTAAGGFSPDHDVYIYNVGASVYCKPCKKFHLFVEAVALWGRAIDDDTGTRDYFTEVILNPGGRLVIAQLENIEWVLGVGIPIGLTRDAPNIGVFAYMSVEHSFRKIDKEGE